MEKILGAATDTATGQTAVYLYSKIPNGYSIRSCIKNEDGTIHDVVEIQGDNLSQITSDLIEGLEKHGRVNWRFALAEVHIDCVFRMIFQVAIHEEDRPPRAGELPLKRDVQATWLSFESYPVVSPFDAVVSAIAQAVADMAKVKTEEVEITFESVISEEENGTS